MHYPLRVLGVFMLISVASHGLWIWYGKGWSDFLNRKAFSSVQPLEVAITVKSPPVIQPIDAPLKKRPPLLPKLPLVEKEPQHKPPPAMVSPVPLVNPSIVSVAPSAPTSTPTSSSSIPVESTLPETRPQPLLSSVRTTEPSVNLPLPAPVTGNSSAATLSPRSDATYLYRPEPNYPRAAHRRGEQGTVMVRVLVSATGIAQTVALEKSSGFASLDQAALAHVSQCRFVPAQQDGHAVQALYKVPVVFKLE
jgi:protein TonB